jgi:hypothetical protein
MGKGIAYDVPQGVRDVVKENLSGHGFFSGFEGYYKQVIGFDRLTQLKDIQAGEPIPLYNIESDKVISKNTSVSTVAKPTLKWIVPLMVKNVCVSVLEIQKINGNWQGLRIGGHEGFAINLENIRAAWPNDTFVLIDIPRLNRMCFHIPRVGDFNLTPLYKKEPFYKLNKDEDTLYTSLTNMKIAVKKVNEVIIAKHKCKEKGQLENEIY